MIVLTFVDIVILLAAFTIVLLRIRADIIEVTTSRTAMRTMKQVARRSFRPKLTVLLTFRSTDHLQLSLERLSTFSYPLNMVVIVNSTDFADAPKSIRSFIKKQRYENVKVIQRKKPDYLLVAKENAKTSLVVLLPDSVELYETVYDDALILFGNNTVDAVQLGSSTRPTTTLISGLEVLITAWRQYISFTRTVTDQNLLSEGRIVRTKFIRRVPKKRLLVLKSARPVYSVAAQKTITGWWHTLYKSKSAADLIGMSLLIIMTLLVQFGQDSGLFAAVTVLILQGVLIWWVLDKRHISLLNKISLFFLTPFFSLLTIGLALYGTYRLVIGGSERISTFGALAAKTLSRA